MNLKSTKYILKSLHKNLWYALFLLLVSLVFTFFISYFAEKNIENTDKNELQLVCQDINSKIRSRLYAHAELLRSGSAFFSSSDSVTRQDWQEFYKQSRINDYLPGIQGFGFSLLIPKKELKHHIQTIRRSGFPEYEVKPIGDREIYTSAIYIEPFSMMNQRAFGYDMFSESVRRTAMEISRDKNIAMLTGKVTLVQETNKNIQAGTLMYVPVYKKGMPIESVNDRRAAIIGWVYSPYRMNDLMNGVLGRWDIKNRERIHMKIFDERISTKDLLFDSQNDDSSFIEKNTRKVVIPLLYNGKKWIIVYSQVLGKNQFIRGQALILLISGIIISFLLFSLTLGLINTRFRAQQIAEQLTSELKYEKERFQTLLNSSAEAIYGLDLLGNCTFSNATCLKLLGYKTEKEILGKNMHNVIHHSHIDGKPFDVHDCKVFKAIQEGIGTHVDDEVLWRADGTYFPSEYWSYPIFINGKLTGAVVTFFDISERKLAEQALKDSEERWKFALEGAGDGVWDWNIEQNRVFFSKQWKGMLGYIDSEIHNDFEEWQKRVHPDDLQNSLEKVKKHLKGETPLYSNTHRLLCKDGSYKWILARAKIIEYDSIRNPIRMIGTHTDLSERIKIEEALKESEAKLSAILRTQPDILSIYNLDGVCLDFYAPSSTTQIIRSGIYIGKKIQDVLPSVLVEKFIPAFSQAIESKKMQFFEYSLFEADGLHYYEVRLINFDTDKILSIVRDITNRKNAEDQIEQTRNNYESFFNTIDDFLFVLDESGNIIHINNTVIRRLEYSPEELFGKSVLFVHPEERRAEAGQTVADMLAGTASFCPVPLVSKSGEYIDVETRVTKGIWNGKPALYGVTKDISKIKLSEEKFSKAFHSNGALMALSSIGTGRFIDVNESFLLLLGYKKDEVIGKNSADLHIFAESTSRNMVIEFLQTQNSKRDIEVELQTKKGERKIGLFSAEKIYIGHDLCLLTTMIDVTYRKEAEAIITKQNLELQKINIDKDRFISILAHDLRSPFNAILGFSDILINNVRIYDVDKIEQLLLIIYRASKQTFNLLNELLTWAKSQAGKLPFEQQTLNVANVCDDIVENLQIVAEAKNIKIYHDINANIRVYADNNMLHTILRNLVSNAIKFTNVGGQIILYAEQTDSEVVITVSDNGVGIAPEMFTKLFNISEVHTTTGTADETGTGLGLLLCKEFVEKHNSKIWVESELGKGSDFKFTMPKNGLYSI